MSIEAIAYVKLLDMGKAEGPSARLLLYVIGENTFNDTGLCKVGNEELSRQTRVHERTIRRQLERLEVGPPELIRRYPRYEEGGGRLNDEVEIIGFRQWLAEQRSEAEGRRKSKPDRSPGKGRGNTNHSKPDNLPGIKPDNDARFKPDTGVRYIKKPVQDNRTSNSPSLPRKRGTKGERASKIFGWLSTIEADRKNQHVFERLIKPLAGALTVQHDDPVLLLREIRDQRLLAELPERLLARLALRLTQTRKKLVSVKDVIDALPDAMQGEPRIRLWPDAPSWGAWCEHYGPAVAKFYRTQGFMEVWSEWPPQHPQFGEAA